MNATPAFPFGCVVLAAGAGTRFGEAKAGAMVRDGVRFIDAVVETARLAGADPIVVVVPPGFAAPAGVRAVVNPEAAGEQIKSVRLGLGQLTNSTAVGALLWPVDHPFVRLESALAVVDAAKRTAAPIVIPTYEGTRGHPAWFVRDTWRELVTVAEGGARAVVRAYGPRAIEVPVTDAGVVRDVDTPADFAAGRAGGDHA